MLKTKKNEKGITLVALIVTIIVLLILAGVTVATLTGDNGLINKSGEAKAATENSALREELEVAVLSSFKKGSLKYNLLKEKLDKIHGLTYVTENPTSLPLRVKLKDQEFKIRSDGSIINGFEGDDVQRDPKTFYGSYVTNYECDNNPGINATEKPGKWQIFMADDDNIFLLASNNVTRKYTGTKNGEGYDYDSENYTIETATKMWFGNKITQQYNAQGIKNVLSKLDKQSIYHKWLNVEANQRKNNNNEKAVASILDIDVWAGYSNTKYSKYAIGGPTVEMFCKAYNNSHTGNELEAKEEYDNGYKIQKEGSNPAGNATELKKGAVNSNSDIMLFEQGYWLGSTANNSYTILTINPSGSINPQNTTDDVGFKPLVCLKSDVYLVKNEDGETYSLVLD